MTCRLIQSLRNASEAISTGVMNAFATQSQPDIQVDLSTTVLTPNGDGINDVAQIDLILSQFAASMDVTIEHMRSQWTLRASSHISSALFWLLLRHLERTRRIRQRSTARLYIVRVAIDGDFKQFEDVRPQSGVLNSVTRMCELPRSYGRWRHRLRTKRSDPALSLDNRWN